MRAEVEQVVDKLLEQEPDFDGLDLGNVSVPEPSFSDLYNRLLDYRTPEEWEDLRKLVPDFNRQNVMNVLTNVALNFRGRTELETTDYLDVSCATGTVANYLGLEDDFEEQTEPDPEQLDLGPPRPEPKPGEEAAITVSKGVYDAVVQSLYLHGVPDYSSAFDAGRGEVDIWFYRFEDMIRATSALEDDSIRYTMCSAPAESVELPGWDQIDFGGILGTPKKMAGVLTHRVILNSRPLDPGDSWSAVPENGGSNYEMIWTFPTIGETPTIAYVTVSSESFDKVVQASNVTEPVEGRTV